jgi:hypothetical protein
MEKSKRPNWGTARIAVISLREEIIQALAGGVPVARFYREHQPKLGDLTMGAFQRQVRQIIKTAAAAQDPLPSSNKGFPTDGHKSPTGTFIHHSQVRKDDRQQLLGGGDVGRK